MGLQQDIGELVLKMCKEDRRHAQDSEQHNNLARDYFTEIEHVLNNPVSNEDNDQHLRKLQVCYVFSSRLFAQRAYRKQHKLHWGLQIAGFGGVIYTMNAPQELLLPSACATLAFFGMSTYLMNQARKRMEMFYGPSINTFENAGNLISWYRALQNHEPQLREQIAAYKEEQAV